MTTETPVGPCILVVEDNALNLQLVRDLLNFRRYEVLEATTADEARELLRKAPGVEVMDDRKPGGYPTAATEAANRDTVYVGRIREDSSADRGLNLWVVADNVRKGAATNSVQIAEALAARSN